MNALKAKLLNIRDIISPLTAFFIGTCLTCCAYALMTSISSVRLDSFGVSTSKAGFVLALYYLGFVVASLSAYKVINKVGHIRAFVTYVSIFSALSLMHYFDNNLIFWGFLRFSEGYCIGGSTMCLESWLNSRSNNKNRGMVMSFYMISTYLGSSTAQVMLNIPDQGGVTIYIIVSALFSLSLVPIALTALPTPEIKAYERMPVSKLYHKTPVGVVACFVSGFLVGSFYLLGTIYTQKLGLTLQQTSMFMFYGVLGGLSAQLPVGRISDKMDRRYVLLASCVILCILAPIMHLVLTYNNKLLGVSSFLLGAAMFTMYPICVSHINDLVSDKERVQASGRLILLQGSGLIVGPIIVSFLMEHIGPVSYVLSFSLITAILSVFIGKWLRVKPEIDYVQNTPTTPVPVTTTPMFDKLAADDTRADKNEKHQALKDNSL